MVLPVKASRPYNSSARRQGAEQKRQAVLDSARALFLASGYAGTTIAAIAADAVVSAETIYKTFGSKAGCFATSTTMACWEEHRCQQSNAPTSCRPKQRMAGNFYWL